MDFDVAKSIIDFACESDAQLVQITGGEPMIYSQLKPLLSYCNSKGLPAVLASSGYNCTYDTVSELYCAGLSAICISLNGVREQTDLETRDSYAYAWNAMEEMRTLAISKFINFVITKKNFPELEELILLAKKYDIHKICILKPFGKQMKDQSLDKADLLALNQIVQRENDFLIVENCYLEYWSVVNNRDLCCRDAAQTSYFFRWDGKVQPCSKNCEICFQNVDDLKKRLMEGVALMNDICNYS